MWYIHTCYSAKLQALKAVRVRSFRACFDHRWYHAIISLPVMENSLLVAPDKCALPVMENSLLVAPDKCAFNPNDHYHLA